MAHRHRLIDAIAKAKLRLIGDLPESFEICKYERIGDAVLVEGGPTHVLTRGPRKGQTKFGRLTHKIVITQAEIKAAEVQYEHDTGRCYDCDGDGQESRGWSKEGGDIWKTCRKCGGTGFPKIEMVEQS
jgi:hypothetical protein